jgi:hypothetical protein
MPTSSFILYLIGFIGPILIFLTKYVVKGRTRDMTRLWFLTLFAFIIFYWLAMRDFLISSVDALGLALLWPILAILSFWAIMKLTGKEPSVIPFFNWLAVFLLAVVFSYLLDGIAGYLGWYTYNPAVIDDTTSIMNFISATMTPAIITFMQGILFIGVFFLNFFVYDRIKTRYGQSSTTMLLAGLAIIFGGLLWVITELLMSIA